MPCRNRILANAVIVGVLIVQCLLIGIWTAIAADPSDDGFRGERFDWEVSFHSADRPAQQVYEATFFNDQIIVWTSSTTDARLRNVFSTAAPPGAHRFWHSFFPGGVGTPPGSREHQVSCGGFRAGRWLSADQVNRGSFVIAPIPIMLGFLSIPLLFWLALGLSGRRGRRRRLVGLCTRCGFDLRASVGRCPECGAAIVAEGPAVRRRFRPAKGKTLRWASLLVILVGVYLAAAWPVLLCLVCRGVLSSHLNDRWKITAARTWAGAANHLGEPRLAFRLFPGAVYWGDRGPYFPLPVNGHWYLHVDPSLEAAGVTDDQLPAPGDDLGRAHE